MIHVRVLPFGVLKDWLGASPSTVELPEGATVAALLEHILEQINAGKPAARQASLLRGIAVSVNAEYARPTHSLRDGDEVGLLPPVSGGSASEPAQNPDSGSITLTRDIIDAHSLVAASKRGEDGAVLVFDGIVRNHSRNRQTLYLDYEAYEEMAINQMKALADQARTRFGVRHVTIAHRLGRLHVGETSVLVVVASAHRVQAYEASRWLIDTLKTTVPIWKKETFVDGAAWTDGEPFPEDLAITPPEASDAS
jgi:molybdopterin synthase catalytic subunit/molybdopterin converting factor small subunit